MKLKAKIIAAAVCAMALCVALAGCAGGGTNSGNDATNFQGNWVLSGGNNVGQELKAEDIDAMNQMGLNVYMQLNEGGNAVISLFGENVDGTWEASLRFTQGDIPPAASEVQRDENQQAEPEAEGTCGNAATLFSSDPPLILRRVFLCACSRNTTFSKPCLYGEDSRFNDRFA